MPSPSTSLATQRPDLAESFREFDFAQQGYIAYEVFPVFQVGRQAGNFGRITIEQLLKQRDTRRSPGSGYNRSEFTFMPDTYATEEHGVEEPVDDRERQMFADYFDAETVSTKRCVDDIMRAAEQRMSDLITTPGNWGGTAVDVKGVGVTDTTAGLAAGTPWTDAASTPIDDVNLAFEAVYAASGLWPDTLVLNYQLFRALRRNTQVLEALTSAGAGDRATQKDVGVGQLRDVFAVQKVMVGGATTNTANEGQNASISQIWPCQSAWVGRTADGLDIRQPCAGRTFHWGQDGSTLLGTVESYRDETVRGDVIRVRHDVQEKLLYKEAGVTLTGLE